MLHIPPFARSFRMEHLRRSHSNGKGVTDNMTRIVKTYDFTSIRRILSRDYTKSEDLTEAQKKRF